MTADAVGKHPPPWLVFRMSIAQAEHHEGEPSEEEQAVEQRTSGKAARNAKQGTVGPDGGKHYGNEHDGIDGSVAKELRVAKGTSEGKDSTLFYHALHHQAAKGKHHQAAVQTVTCMTEKPTQAFVFENASARHSQCRQDPRDEWQQRRHDEGNDKSSLLIVHQPQGYRGQGCAAVWLAPRGAQH